MRSSHAWMMAAGSAVLGGVQGRRVGQHSTAGNAQCRDGGVHTGQAGVSVLVHGPVAGGGQGEQVRVVAGRQGADEADPGCLDALVVGGGVLPRVVDHGQRLHAAGQRAVSAQEVVDDAGELGDVGLVAGVGTGQDRDAAVAGGHHRQADQAQVDAFLLGLAALGQVRLVVAGVDEGGEVGHVEDQPRKVQAERGDHAAAQLRLDLCQRVLLQQVHGLPEAAVVHGGDRHLGEPRPGGGLPPPGEAAFEHGAVTRLAAARVM